MNFNFKLDTSLKSYPKLIDKDNNIEIVIPMKQMKITAEQLIQMVNKLNQK